MKNLIKVLTTKTERRLGRMQRSKNTVAATSGSTENNTENDANFLKELILQPQQTNTEREKFLLSGIIGTRPVQDEANSV